MQKLIAVHSFFYVSIEIKSYQKLIYFFPGDPRNRSGLDALKILWVSIKSMEIFPLCNLQVPFFCMIRVENNKKLCRVKRRMKNQFHSTSKGNFFCFLKSKDFTLHQSECAMFLINVFHQMLLLLCSWVNQTMHFIVQLNSLSFSSHRWKALEIESVWRAFLEN